MLSLKFHSWNWTYDSWEQDFYKSSMRFQHVTIISPFEKCVSLHLNELKFPSSITCKNVSDNFGWNLTDGFGRVFNVFLPLGIYQYMLLEKSMFFHCKNLNYISSSKNALCKVWLKMDKCFCRMIFLNVGNVYYLAMISPW